MGGESSHMQERNISKGVFNSQENAKINAIFQEITGKDERGSLVQLKKSLKQILSDDFISKLHMYLVAQSEGCKNEFSKSGFFALLAHLFKGTLTEKSSVILALSSGTDEIAISSLEQFVREMVLCYMRAAEKTKQFRSWQFEQHEPWSDNLSRYILQELLAKDSNESLHIEDIETWLGKSHLFQRILEFVFRSCFPIEQESESVRHLSPLIPEVNNCDWTKSKTILPAAAVLLLNYNLPSDLRREWRPLYSNRQFGDSFSQLLTRSIKNGPSVVVVRDKDGHVFGGFASESWDLRAQFVGSTACFLFSLWPTFNIYTATGYNDHYMYLNKGVQTLPNGLGMGGQLEYFGFWIDQSFNIGHSKAGPLCTTYGSPQLSKSAEFQVDVIEVWGVGPEPKQFEESEEGEVSILDKDPEAKAMLSLIDRGPVSEGLREGDATADSPEEHQLRPL